jgi:glyoxylase-like metal-dependent hydrolase (beta-lactamase superfamily II)
MQRERVADDIYVFTSELYAQVTAGAVITPDGAIVIDTLPYPEETREIKEYIEQRLKIPVRFVVNTHYHADHTNGSCLFTNAVIVGHAFCRNLLDTSGRKSLERAKAQSKELEDLNVVLPEIIFESGCLNLHLGDKTVKLLHSPGHSDDLVMALIPEDRVLFAADTLMPVPTMIDGDIESLITSLRSIIDMPVDNVVQGHGEVILRGEIKSIVEGDIEYLRLIENKVANVIDQGGTIDDLKQIDIESCGKSRIPLNGLVTDLHFANLYKLYRSMTD